MRFTQILLVSDGYREAAICLYLEALMDRNGTVNLLTAREAASFLRVSLFTLNRIERQGSIVPYRTPGGHRRYSMAMLNVYLQASRSNLPSLHSLSAGTSAEV